MGTRRPATLAAFMLVPVLAAQDGELADPASRLRFSVRADGCVTFAIAGERHEPEPLLESIPSAFSNLGVVGLANIIGGGASDLASMADASRFFEMLGMEDAEILQSIAGEPEGLDAGQIPLRRTIAIRAAERRGSKVALPLIERCAQDEKSDRFSRIAAREALAILGGKPRPSLAPELVDLDLVLAAVPADADIVLRVDSHRLAPWPSAGRWARVAGNAAMERVIATRPDGVPDADLSSGLRMTEAVGLFGYELARRYGNHRIDRVVIAIRVPRPPAQQEPLVWITAEGDIDVATIREGLAREQVAGDEIPGGMRIHVGGPFDVEVLPGQLRLRCAGFGDRDGDEASEVLRNALGGATTHAVWIADGVPFPEQFRRIVPRSLQLDLPRTPAGELRLDGVWADATGAAGMRTLLRSGPGFVERAAEALESLDPLLEALDHLVVETDGARLSAHMPVPELDVEAALVELIRSGSLR